MKYKVTNILEKPVKFKGVLFGPNETKILTESPTSDIFTVEKLEENEKRKKLKGGK